MLGNHFLPAVSALLFAILLGAIIANTMTLPESFAPGVGFTSKKLLRAGIVLLGLQVVLGDIARLGWGMLGVVVAVVGVGIVATMLIGRALGLPWAQRALIACGFSICGAAAVAACDGVIDAEDEEVATAIALVVLFGTLMIPIIPALVTALAMQQTAGGLWAGSCIHEVAQVVAAAGIIGPEALRVGVIVKLTRVLMLAPVMAVFGLLVRRRHAADGYTGKQPPLVPLFVLGFIAAMIVASLHVLPASVLTAAKLVQTFLLAAAMFGLGLGVKLKQLFKVGPKPFVLGAVSTLIVALVGWGGVALVA